MATYIRLLRNRPFVLLWLGQIVSRLGDVLYYAGMLWLVKELTHSNTVTGLAGMAMALPQLAGCSSLRPNSLRTLPEAERKV